MFIKFLMLFGIIILVLIAGHLFLLINLNFPMCVFMCLCVYICVHAHVCDGVCACMCTCVCGGQRQLFFKLCLPWFWDNSLPVACQYVAIKPPPLLPYHWITMWCSASGLSVWSRGVDLTLSCLAGKYFTDLAISWALTILLRTA